MENKATKEIESWAAEVEAMTHRERLEVLNNMNRDPNEIWQQAKSIEERWKKLKILQGYTTDLLEEIRLILES